MQEQRPATLWFVVAVGLAGPLSAQTPVIRIGGRVQVHYRSSAGDSSGSYDPHRVSNGFEVRRLRIQADGQIGDRLTFVIQPSYEMAALRMRDAYVRVRLTPALFLSVGQEKSPFQRYELTSANALPSIERGLRNLRLTGREGLNDLLIQNGYAQHDIGAFLELDEPAGRLAVKAGVTNGSRESSADVNSAKSVFARAGGIARRDAEGRAQLQLGVALASRDRAVCSTCTGTIAFYADSSRRTTAFGADLEWGGFRPGLHVIADVASGDNVRLANRVGVGRNTGNMRSTADSAIATFRGASVVAAWRTHPRGETRFVKFLEPALRLDWLDPDTGAPGDAGLLVTPAVSVFFAQTVVMRAALDLYRYEDAGIGRTAMELRVAWEASF